MVRAHHWKARLFLTLACAWPVSARAQCEDLLPGVMTAPGPTSAKAGAAKARRVTARDILLLRDIGQPDGSMFNEPSPLGISPNGRQAAFVINRADPDRNAYCRGLVVMDLVGPARTRLVDRGGDLITYPFEGRGVSFAGGFPSVVTPVWSPDGAWIAYLRRDHDLTQVWRVRADGSEAKMITGAAVDVIAVAWDKQSGRIVFVSQPGMSDSLRAIAREGQSGWLYDARFIPNVGARPLPAPAARTAFSINRDGGDLRSASVQERALVGLGSDLGGVSIQPSHSAASPDGRRAETRRVGGGAVMPLELSVIDRDGKRATCAFASCAGGFTGLWWDEDGKDLLFLRREGWAQGEMGLYRWRPGDRAPRRVLHTRDVLQGCVLAKGNLLVCTRENANTPRYLATINTRDGRGRSLFDPNPEFAHLALGKVERLRWTNSHGLDAWGDLVLPPGYVPGSRLPMIVVQYHSDGFLRGGTGDEYPIHAFAAAGFAVLSVERATFVAAGHPEFKSANEAYAFAQIDWGERRSLLSSLETGVRMVVDRGIADPTRVGITGLSDGASSVRFALINSRLFAAAAISTCCIERDSLTSLAGIAVANDFASIGYPAPGKDPGDFWKPYSFALNADRIDQPLLMQVSDDEYLLALQPFTALKAAGKPVEMYVFPGEHHMKWQPTHRAAIYQRNLDWFAFWLQHRIDPAPAKSEQYMRWKSMR